jgi:hypothetical protein
MNRLRHHVRDAAAVGLLCLLVIACTWRIALAGRVLAGGDIFSYFYPYWAEATRAIRAARLPLWNSSLFMGVPFAANSQVGLFYPLNWPLWLLWPAHRSVHLTIVLHLCLAALSAYLWGRRSLHLGRVASWAVGAVFALGGYMGAQVEHVNQLQGLAWLPLMLMLSDRIARGVMPVSKRLKASCALAAVIGMVLLAGHTQTAFISLFGMAVYGLVPALWRSLRGRSGDTLMGASALLGFGAVLGVVLGAVQLLPTWELSGLSVRAQGLPFNERVSFSLSPAYVGRALLPAFGHTIPPGHLEHVAYVGIVGLALAIVGFVMDRDSASRAKREEQTNGLDPYHPVYLLILLGLFFALGLYNPLYVLLARYVPGFAHFRVPARWLSLYACGVAALAGRAVQALWEGRSPGGRRMLVVVGSLTVLVLWAVVGTRLVAYWGEGLSPGGRLAGGNLSLISVVGWVGMLLGALGLLLMASKRRRAATVGLLALLIGELFLASRALPHTRATAPQAFTSVRPAVAHLLASQRSDAEPGGRFLSMSDTTFDPGDLSLIRRIYGPQLSSDQLYDYVVATKQKEILSPNLPLAFGVPALDGYDGGLLPLQRYVMLQRAFLPPEDVSIDGRLRENLTAIPEGRWLSLFNVRYVITDKLRDAWIDDVFYDLQFGARLSRGETAAVAEVPRFEATALGVISHLEQGASLPEGASVGLVNVGFADGDVRSFELRAGEEVPEASRDQQVIDAMATRLRWSEPATPLTVTVEAIAPEGAWIVRGMSLIDERTGSFQSLVVSDRGRFRLAHSGDVKIYENLDVLPRAFVVPKAEVVADDEEALRALQDPSFDPLSRVVLSGSGLLLDRSRAAHVDGTLGATAVTARSANALVTTYRPERVVIEAELNRPGYLVLTDAHYPGWQAAVDGERAPIYRADLLFRAVALEPGEHRVIFTFRPTLQRLGVAVSILGLVVFAVVWYGCRIVESVGRCYNSMQGWAGKAVCEKESTQ